MHLQILENIFKRESMSSLNIQSLSIENSTNPNPLSDISDKDELNSSLILKDEVDELPLHPEPAGVKLDTVDDPITGKIVAPPPYVVTLHAIDRILNNWDLRGLSTHDKQTIRFLGYYFPHTISLCGTNDGLHLLFLCSFLRYLSFGASLGLGIWQVSFKQSNKSFLLLLLQ